MEGDTHMRAEENLKPMKKDEEKEPPPTARESQELKEIYRKKYEEGDAGKLEALRDLQNVFDELHEQKIISQPVDVMNPRNDPTIQSNTSQPSKSARKRFTNVMLTPRPPPNKFKPKEFTSEQTLINKGGQKQQQTASLSVFRVESSKSENDQDKQLLPATEDDDDDDSFKQETEAFRLVNENLDACGHEDGEEYDSETETFHPSTDPEDICWKADLHKLTKLRSTSKINIPLQSDGDTLQLKYKSPVWPHQLALHQILTRMPTLTCLVLDGSELQCLRDLGGSHIPSLVTLSVARCGLKSLDGTGAFTNLRTLVASNNNLEHVMQCSYLTEICHLDLSSNPIRDIESFAHLNPCTKLRSLKLYSTPVSQNLEFYSKVKFFLPKLKELYPMADSTAGFWTKSKTTDKTDAMNKDEVDHVQKIMKNEFEVIYQQNFQKLRIPTRILQEQEERKQRNQDNAATDSSDAQKDSVTTASSTTDGTSTETDDNFEKTLIKSIKMTKLGDSSSN